MNDQFQGDALSDALVPHSPDVRPRPDTPLGHLQFRYPQPDPKTLPSLADAVPWMNDVERSRCLLETCRIVERLSPLQRIVFDAERDRCEAGVEDSPDPIVIGVVGALVSGGVRLARDPRWLRLVKGGVSLSTEMSALLADVRDAVPGFDYLAYAEANPEEIVDAVRSYNYDAYEHLILLLHIQQLNRLIPAEDRGRDFSGVYGPHGFRIHVFADGKAFSDEEMIDAAIGRFQDH